MARIAVDIDDTLYSFGNLARDVMAELAVEQGDLKMQEGAYASWEEWRTPPALLGNVQTWLDVIAICHEPGRIQEQVPFVGAAETLWDLVHQGHSLTYISNRDPETVLPTWNWLQDMGFPVGRNPDGDHLLLEHRLGSAERENTIDGFSHAKLICTADAKGPYVRDCQYIIDDRVKTLIEFTTDFQWKNKYGSENEERRRIGFGLMTPYNRGLTDAPAIYLAPNWNLLRFYLVKKGVLDGHRTAIAA